MRSKVYLRADASRATGYGHFIRSLALASMLKDDFDCTFFTANPDGYMTRECACVCPLVPLKDGKEGDAEFLGALRGGEIVILDNYYFGTGYQAAVKAAGCTLVCVDDLHDRTFCADAVISPCLMSPSLYAGLLREDTALCLGRPLLRQPFLDAAGRVRGHKYDYLICFGATDQMGLASVCASLLPSGTRVAVLGGSADVTGADCFRNLDASEVCGLMMESDAVICSASSVCFEALACGCKVYAGWYVDNQKDVYEGLREAGLISPLGYLPDVSRAAAFVSLIPPTASCGSLPLTAPWAARAAAPANTREELEYDCVSYYCRLLRALSLRIVNYTELSDRESEEVWRLRNAPEIRRWMSHSEPFPQEEHRKFVSSLSGRRDSFYYAFFDGDRLVGSYDFHVSGDGLSAGRGLFVAPEHQGKDFAGAMDTYMEALMTGRGIRGIRAEVLSSNEKSLRYHEKTGYVEMSRGGGYVNFTKKLF